MKKYQLHVGIDVSKLKLDVCLVKDSSEKDHLHFIVPNTKKGITSLWNRIFNKKMKDLSVLFCFENTGVYSMSLCYWLQEFKADYWVIPALEIKRAKGISRGKSDKIDAKDIAFYSITHGHKLRLCQLPEDGLIELRLLLSEREKLIKAIGGFMSTQEAFSFLSTEIITITSKINSKTISLLKKQLQIIDCSIKKIINQHPVFKQQDELLQSIPGIGIQTSVNLIVYTNCFTAFDNWRKFACYAGIAPFEYSSGSSIRGRTKVNHLANKKLKAQLNMAALAAKKFDKEMGDYFNRKVNTGKNKMLVLNAIRCKVVSRAFAVIKRNTPFVNTLKAVA
jgi:transposase